MIKNEEEKIKRLNYAREVMFEYMPFGGKSLMYLASNGMTMFKDAFLPPLTNSVLTQVKVFNTLAGIAPEARKAFDNERVKSIAAAHYRSGAVTKEEKETALRQVHDAGVFFTGVTKEVFLDYVGADTLEEYAKSRVNNDLYIIRRRNSLWKIEDTMYFCLDTLANTEEMFDNFSDIFIEGKNNE